MKKFLLSIVLVTLSFGFEIPKNHIITTELLEKNLLLENLVIIDTRKAKAYNSGHIAKAINLPKADWFKGKISNVPKLYNTPEQIQDMFSKAGITQDSILVFYSGGVNSKDFADAASGIWNAWVYGFKNSVILNGGFAKWKEENRATTKDVASIKTSDFKVDSYNKKVVASLNDIIEATFDDDIQITDARVAKFYRGEDNRKDLSRHGRIPTAKLTPMIRQTKKVGNHFELLSSKEAKKTLTNGGFGIDLNKPLIIYCNTGHKARGLWFVSKFLVGMKDVKVFDGSMVEYSRTSLAMETGEAME